VGDYVMMGGQVGVADHFTIGDGAMLAARSGVITDVPAGARYNGWPAQPAREWLRGVAWLRRVARRGTPSGAGKDDEGNG
jgi:UDP-3-O-[3-hydroxymyristoyl] glucosamine N-acyltransferase